jgi:hypothetical protein
MARLRYLTLCTMVTAGLIFTYGNRLPTTIPSGDGLVIKKEWLAINKNPITPQQDVRPADQTFLTFPEWYLVFSPDEQARYFEKQTSTSFPFMSHVRQIWESYHIVNAQIKDNFPPNDGYHFMIWVIGTSSTIEYAIKAWYETIVGRITDTHTPVADEDLFNAKFNKDYVAFIKDRPWYEFDFKSRLKSLWTETSLIGHNVIRKLERRYILTSELLVKWAYGKIIGLGTQQVYDAALPTTAVVLQDSTIEHLPRYDKFGKAITDLSIQGKSFREIAGNNSAILLSILLPSSQRMKFENIQVVFVQPITSDRTMKRIALVTQVPHLYQLLTTLHKENITIEHVFDY